MSGNCCHSAHKEIDCGRCSAHLVVAVVDSYIVVDVVVVVEVAFGIWAVGHYMGFVDGSFLLSILNFFPRFFRLSLKINLTNVLFMRFIL